jgi:hypothetical protein
MDIPNSIPLTFFGEIDVMQISEMNELRDVVGLPEADDITLGKIKEQGLKIGGGRA